MRKFKMATITEKNREINLLLTPLFTNPNVWVKQCDEPPYKCIWTIPKYQCSQCHCCEKEDTGSETLTYSMVRCIAGR